MSKSKSMFTLFDPAADRSKEHILQVLKQYIPAYIDAESSCRRFRCLEISSGSGQQVIYFAKDFPSVTFQPSEYDKSMFDNIRDHIRQSALKNINSPVFLDAQEDFGSWVAPNFNITQSSLDFIININMIHVSPIRCTEGLLKNAGVILRLGGFLFTYGAYSFDGVISPESNVRFNADIQARDPEWGIRDVGTMLVPLATNAGLRLVETVAMPANNHMLVHNRKH